MSELSELAAAEAEAGERRVARWHLLWALLCLGAGAAVTVVAGRAPVATYGAFGALAGMGLLGWLLHGHGRVLIGFWATAALFAVCGLGGLTGPGAAWALLPLGVAPALARGWREGVTWTAAVALLAAMSQAAAVTADAPVGLAAGAAGLAAVALTAWIWISGERVAPAEATSVAPALDRREAVRADALATELQSARDELEAVRALAQTAETGRTEAEAASQAKSRFLAAMSHELRTPLNAVMGFADIMRNRLFGPLPDRYAEYSQLIHESGAHLLDLINDVLDLSKIEADRYRLERETFDAREAAASVLKLMRVQADEAGLELRDALPDGPLMVDADRRALKQIALNLLANAFKFTPPGGTVTLALEEVDGALEMTVADTGIGIAPEDLERLGRPYEQAGDSDTRALGTGLGLSLVRAFAGLHDGAMTLESELGEGTAVTVRLPVLAPEGELFSDRGEGAQVIPFQAR